MTFRRYQQPAFWDHSTKTLIEHWSRQIGKSYTYAAWAVDRLLRYPGRLVTVLSNSRENGAEFVAQGARGLRETRARPSRSRATRPNSTATPPYPKT